MNRFIAKAAIALATICGTTGAVFASPITATTGGVAHAYVNEISDPTGRAKIDPNRTNITVYFNRNESKKIALYGPAAVAPAVVVPWVGAIVGVTTVYVQDQVFNKGKCIKYVKPYLSRAYFALYTGRHCN